MGMRDAGCALFLLGMVARPEQGLEADGIAGGGRYRTQSCGTNPAYSYYAEETYAGRLRYVAGNGLTGAVDSSGSRAVLKQGPGTNRDAFDLEARVLPYVSPALSVRYNSSDNWNVAGGLTFRFDP